MYSFGSAVGNGYFAVTLAVKSAEHQSYGFVKVEKPPLADEAVFPVILFGIASVEHAEVFAVEADGVAVIERKNAVR